MRETSKVENRIDELKKVINNLMSERDSCDKKKLLEVSQELDRVICEYIQINDKK